jgi:peptide deformylase
MAKLEILHYPDPRLRNPAEPVETVDDAIGTLAEDMFETMYAAPGIGLAAPQVNQAVQLIVIDVSERNDDPICLINPRIIESAGSIETEEGCLSVPGIYETVVRSESIKVAFLDRDGEASELETEGILAVCIQHEMDHLKGTLFVDYLSRIKQQRIRKRARKQQA